MESWVKFYADIYSFVNANCARLQVTRILLRVTLPVFPLNQAGPWWPPNASPMYTELISKLDDNVELFVYPYVMEEYNQQMWAQLSSDGTNTIEGVFAFAGEWNAFLQGVGSRLRFDGVVLDYEEFYKGRNPEIRSQVLNIASLKAQYNMKSGISFGYQSWAYMTEWDSVMDEYYLQFYDYYYSPLVDRTENSPFIIYKNDPAGLVEFTLSTALENLSENPAKYPPKVQVMWSIQSLKADCIYPMTDGTCGMNWEFGNWDAASFNEYLREFRKQSPNLGSKPQGIFQFSFIPNNWFIRN